MTADPDDQAFTELELDHIGEDEFAIASCEALCR